MVIDLIPSGPFSPWMLFSLIVTLMFIAAGAMCLVDWMSRKFNKIDSDK